MPTDKQIARVSASEYVSPRPRSPLARGYDGLPPKPVRSAILAAKPSESGECRLIRKEISAILSISSGLAYVLPS